MVALIAFLVRGIEISTGAPLASGFRCEFDWVNYLFLIPAGSDRIAEA